MKLIYIALALSLSFIAALAVYFSMTLPSRTSCQPVMVLAVGGCDGDGLCSVIVGNQQGQVKKDKLSYPIAGAVEELCE
jgi:hypothetical protein